MPQTDMGHQGLLQGVSVLLAEDNVTNQLVATQMLKTMGAEVDIASDGAIALERLKDRIYDVLLIDIEMPRVSGLDVIRSIRASAEPLASAPVIALTAYAMQEHREKIQKVGADALIPKPITSIRQFGVDIRAVMDARAADNSAMQSHPGSEGDGPSTKAEVDREIYENLVASVGPDAMAELMGRLIVDLRAIREDIETAGRGGDAGLMKGATHILISIAGAIGGVALQAKSEQVNRLINEGKPVVLDDESAQILPELDAMIEFVDQEIGLMNA